MKCPSDKYKRQQEAGGWQGGRGWAQGDTPGNTPVTCRPNKIEIFKTFPDSTTRSLLFPIPTSALARVAKAVGVVCVCVCGGVAVGVVEEGVLTWHDLARL